MLLRNNSAKKLRPTTAIPKDPKNPNKNNNINNIIKETILKKFDAEIKNDYKYEDSFFNEIEDNNNYENNNNNNNNNDYSNIEIYENESDENSSSNNNNKSISQKKPSYPFVEKLIRNYNKLNVKSYSIKTNQADTDLLEIFDKSQNTKAATLSKVGDFNYYREFERIGSFMDYGENITWKDLKNIQKNIKETKTNFSAYQSRHNIQPPNRDIFLENKCNFFNDPNSMFHGFMPLEYEGEFMISEYNKKNNIYDPIDFLGKYISDDILDENKYSDEFKKNILTSLINYNKYLYSDKITSNDIFQFNKKALKKKIVKKINFNFRKLYKKLINQNLSELEELYIYTIKQIIMNYILRCPDERQRLNITHLLRKTLPSSYTIAKHGSFNRNKYIEWINNYNTAFNFLEKNLSLCNISISALIDWTTHFNHFELIYLNKLNTLWEKDYHCINIDNFCSIQLNYMNKSFRFLRDIFYRGCLLIIRKNKYLKRRDIYYKGRWTFKGFIPYSSDFIDYENIDFGMNYEDQLMDFWSYIDLEDLIDIRLTPSNIGYMTYMLHKKIDLSKNDYDNLSNENKLKLNNSATTYISIFFRKIVEKSLYNFLNFFESYETNKYLYEHKSKTNQINFIDQLEYKEKEIHLPDMLSFHIIHLVEPIISIKTKYDESYNLVKLEYTYEEIYEKLANIIDNMCNLFNTIVTTHFLDFSNILPTEREKIVKEHSSKINNYFNTDPSQNKSFDEDYYKNLCPNLITKEVDNNLYIKSYFKIINKDEYLINDIKSKIYRKIKIIYTEIEESLNIFEPLKDVIKNIFSENLKNFCERKNEQQIDYMSFMKHLDKINFYIP